jgi:hypothetical protein
MINDWFPARCKDILSQMQRRKFLFLCRPVRKKKSMYSSVIKYFLDALIKNIIVLFRSCKMRQEVIA